MTRTPWHLKLPNPTLVWDADTQTLTVTRRTEFAATTTTQVFATAYERISGVSSTASNLGSSSVSLPFLRAVDDTSVQFDLPIPVGAETGTLSFSATAQSASQANDENMGAATVFVDLVNGLSSGASSMFRASRPDLILWDNLPYNVDVLDANTVAGASVTGNLGDDYKNAYLEQHFAVLSFDRVNDTNGVDVLRGTFNYTEDGGVAHLDDFVIHSDWFGPQSITVPSPNALGNYVGTTDPLAEDPVTGRYIVPNDEADLLAFEPAANASGIFDATVNQGGFVSPLSIEITADAETPTLNTISLDTAQNFPSDISNAIQATIGDSDDTNESISSILITIPEGHTIDDGVNGSVTADTGGQTIEIATWSFNTLTYESPDLGDFDVSVTVTATDEHGFTATDDSSTNDSETATDTFTVTVLLDTDGDGIPDATEGTGDTDGDGTPDNEDTDSDNDGTPNITEGTGDADGDGTPDYLDDDFDNDGITDNLDLDLDNDGIPNTTECSAATGTINEGLDTTTVSGNYSIDGNDVMAFNLTGPYAFDQLGSTERLQVVYNQRQNRVANLNFEFASPNSGLLGKVVIGTGAPGVQEGGEIARKDITVTWSGGGAAVINDPDGEIMNYDTDDVVTSGVVLQTAIRNLNTTQWSLTVDLSGVTIFPTSIGFSTDATAHPRDSINNEAFAFSVTIECDTDGDGIPDVNDLDSDGDSISDLIESGVNASLVDPDGDGMYDVSAVDNDGVPTAANGGVTPVDTDGDGIPDTQDSDSDDDGTSDANEGASDNDNDGLPDYQDNNGGLDPVVTNESTPTLSGKTYVAPGETLSITINGVTYIAGDGNLVANTDSTWALSIPSNDALPEGTYDVATTVTDADGNAITDIAVGSLSVDITDPATPSSNIQITNNTTPTITGTATVVAGESLTVTVGDNIYTSGDGNLALNGNNWALIIPAEDALDDGNYEVIAIVTDQAGNFATGTSTLSVDTVLPITPVNGIIDTMLDSDSDGIPDSVDVSQTAGEDTDNDDIDDRFDASFLLEDDLDGDGIVDSADPDADGDGLADDPQNVLALGQALPDNNDNGEFDVFEVDEGALRVGLSGRGGCSISPTPSNGSVDPLFALMLSVVATLLWRRRLIRIRGVESVCNSDASRRSLQTCLKVKSTQAVVGSLLPIAIFFTTAFAVSITTTDAHADSRGLQPWLGVGVGISRLQPDASAVNQRVIDDRDTAFSAMLGLDLNHRFGVQLGYTDLGRAELTNNNHIAYYEFSVDTLIYGLASRFRREHRLGFLPFGRVGISKMKNSSSLPFVRENDVSINFGLGLEYATHLGLAARVEVTSFDTDALFAGVGLLYRFGTHNKHPAQATAAVTRPPATTLPEEITAVDKTPELPKTLTLGPVLFDPDSDLLNTASRMQVARVATILRKNTGYEVVIEGYSDLLGPAPYNLALSQRRAIAVKDELDRLGIEVNGFTIRPIGKTDRFGSMSTTEGRQQNRRVNVVANPRSRSE